MTTANHRRRGSVRAMRERYENTSKAFVPSPTTMSPLFQKPLVIHPVLPELVKHDLPLVPSGKVMHRRRACSTSMSSETVVAPPDEYVQGKGEVAQAQQEPPMRAPRRKDFPTLKRPTRRGDRLLAFEQTDWKKRALYQSDSSATLASSEDASSSESGMDHPMYVFQNVASDRQSVRSGFSVESGKSSVGSGVSVGSGKSKSSLKSGKSVGSGKSSVGSGVSVGSGKSKSSLKSGKSVGSTKSSKSAGSAKSSRSMGSTKSSKSAGSAKSSRSMGSAKSNESTSTCLKPTSSDTSTKTSKQNKPKKSTKAKVSDASTRPFHKNKTRKTKAHNKHHSKSARKKRGNSTTSKPRRVRSCAKLAFQLLVTLSVLFVLATPFIFLAALKADKIQYATLQKIGIAEPLADAGFVSKPIGNPVNAAVAFVQETINLCQVLVDQLTR